MACVLKASSCPSRAGCNKTACRFWTCFACKYLLLWSWTRNMKIVDCLVLYQAYPSIYLLWTLVCALKHIFSVRLSSECLHQTLRPFHHHYVNVSWISWKSVDPNILSGYADSKITSPSLPSGHLLLLLRSLFSPSSLLDSSSIHEYFVLLTSFLLLPWMWWLFLMMSSSFTSLSSDLILPSFMSHCVKCLKYLHWHQQKKKVSKLCPPLPLLHLLHFLCLLPVFSESQSLHSLLHILLPSHTINIP